MGVAGRVGVTVRGMAHILIYPGMEGFMEGIIFAAAVVLVCSGVKYTVKREIKRLAAEERREYR